MSGTLTISFGINRTVKVISKSTGNEETFVIPNINAYQLILEEDCKIHISNNTAGTLGCQLLSDNNPSITMKVLKMSNSESLVNNRFSGNYWLKEFNHEVRDNWDNVTTMGDMFRDCANLTSATLPNTLPNVTSMGSMFTNCGNLTNVTLPNELPNVTRISEMFKGCTSFNGDLSNTKFKSDVNKGTGGSTYDFNTPKWEAKHKPQFVL